MCQTSKYVWSYQYQGCPLKDVELAEDEKGVVSSELTTGLGELSVPQLNAIMAENHTRFFKNLEFFNKPENRKMLDVRSTLLPVYEWLVCCRRHASFSSTMKRLPPRSLGPKMMHGSARPRQRRQRPALNER